MRLWKWNVFLFQLALVVCQNDDESVDYIKLSRTSPLKPTELRPHVVVNVATYSRTRIVAIDVSTAGRQQVAKRILRVELESERQELTVDIALSSQSLWETYRRGWRLEICAALLSGDDETTINDETTIDDDHSYVDHESSSLDSWADDVGYVTKELSESDWRQTLSHDELLELSVDSDCHVIGSVHRRDVFCWNWLSAWRHKLESTCHNGNGTAHILDFPIALTGGRIGLKRQPTLWQPHDDYLMEFPMTEPQFTLSLWLYVSRPCDSSLCAVLIRPHKTLYHSPSLFFQFNGILLIQFVLVDGTAKIYSLPWVLPSAEWLHVTVAVHAFNVQVCVWCMSVSGVRCYDISFNDPFRYDDSIPWVIGGATSHQSVYGIVAKATLYRGLQLPMSDQVPSWLTVTKLEQNCSRLKQEVRLLQQYAVGQGTKVGSSCSLAKYLSIVFKSHILNDRQCHMWSAEAARMALTTLQRRLRLNHSEVYSLVHSDSIPQHLMTNFQTDMEKVLGGQSVAFDLSLYATYAGCFNTPDAFFVAGILHLIGHIKVPDQLQGVSLLLAAAAQGSVLSQLALGYRHRFGKDGLPKSCPIALNYYVTVARDAVGALQGGDETKVLTESIRLSEPETLDGQGGERDDVIQYLLFEAANGNPIAQVNLGRMHYWGQQGLRRDFNQAFHHYARAAAAGLPDAHYNLAIMYLKGQGTQQDNETALKHLEIAAEQGVVAALNGLGYFHLNLIEPPNVTAAVQYFEKAYLLGDHDAAYNLGVVYYNGIWQQYSNKSMAAMYWRSAAKRGNPGATYQMALLSETCSEALGYGVAIAEHHSDIGRVLKAGVASYLNDSVFDAAIHYIQAAEVGVELAAFNVAWLMETSPDLQSSVASNFTYRYYGQSALLNYSSSVVRVGDSYWVGEWADEDKQHAILYYSRAAHLGNGQGTFNLGYIVQMGLWPVEREWVEFDGLSLGVRIRGNLTLAAQLYDLCWTQDSYSRLPCFLAGLYVRMFILRDGMLTRMWPLSPITTVLWQNLYLVAAVSGCILGLILRLEVTRRVQHGH